MVRSPVAVLSLAMAALSGAVVRAQSSGGMPNVTGINLPLIQCHDVSFSLTGGTSPYNLSIMIDGSNSILYNWWNLQEGCYSWALAVDENLSMMWMITDQASLMTATPYLPIEPGSTDCMAAASSEMGATHDMGGMTMGSDAAGETTMDHATMTGMDGMSMRARAIEAVHARAKRQNGFEPVAIRCPENFDSDGGGGGGKSNAGAIAGGVVGGLAAVALVAAAVFFMRRRRQRQMGAAPDPFKSGHPGHYDEKSIPPNSAGISPFGAAPYPYRDDSPHLSTPGPPGTAAGTSSSGGHDHSRSAGSTPSQPLFPASLAGGMASTPAPAQQSFYAHAPHHSASASGSGSGGGYSGAAELQQAETIHQPDVYPSFQRSSIVPSSEMGGGNSGTMSSAGSRSSHIMHGPRPLSGK